MSVPSGLLFAILGHDSRAFCLPCELNIYSDSEHDTVRPHVRTLADILPYMDDWHSYYCRCGLKLSSSVWRADIPYGRDCEVSFALYEPKEDQLLDCSLPLQTVFPSSDVPQKTIHLVFSTDGQPAEPFLLALRGLHHYEGRVYRVLGSQKILLPNTPNFADIASSPGRFYVGSADSMMNALRGPDFRANPLIPVIRRPAGFGKTTFLSAFSSRFDLAFDRVLLPSFRGGDDQPPPTMLVFWIDLSGLTVAEDMTDNELNAECERVMWDAAAKFYTKYVPLLNGDDLLFSRRRVDGSPYGVVRKLARDHGHKIFLAIDNYTATFMALAPALREPLEEGSLLARVELAIVRLILAHIFVDVGTGAVARGLITGTALPNERCRITLPLSTSYPFEVYTRDLTEAAAFAQIIGFTRADIEALVKHVLQVSDADVAARAAAIVPREFECGLDTDDDSEDRKEALYSAQKVINALRAAMLDDQAELDDALHVPASESTGSTGSAVTDRIALQTPIDTADTFTQVEK
ncbi:hypothetical protein AURDEDRAFT_159208 [Auricularia subglabra TFB-10046 SS5]|nr:hypothetical protein AURDEDRAFT_159208 [Auricularia subglabra TFB-10046 SS5]